MKTQEQVICKCGTELTPYESKNNVHRYKCKCGKKYKLIIKIEENL